MSIQASVYNRSWLKPQWAKLLVLIVLIVPFVVAQQNTEAAAVEPGSPFDRTVKDSVFPNKDEPASRNRRLDEAIDMFNQRNAADEEERANWLALILDFIRGGHFDFAAKLMETDPSFFHPNEDDLRLRILGDSRYALAYSHEALALLANKTEVDADDLKNLASIIANSDCVEWEKRGLYPKEDESCKHIGEIQKHSTKKDKPLLKSLAENYKSRVTSCKGPQETECLKKKSGVMNKAKDMVKGAAVGVKKVAVGVLRKLGLKKPKTAQKAV